MDIKSVRKYSSRYLISKHILSALFILSCVVESAIGVIVVDMSLILLSPETAEIRH